MIKAFNKRFPFDQGGDGACARRPAHHPHQDRGRGRQARGRRGQPLRPRSDAGDREPVAWTTRRRMRRTICRTCWSSPKFWPQATLGWAIAYNSAIVKNPPKSWMDLTKPEYKGKQIGQTIGPSGGTTWTRVMFERQVLGEDYWKKQAADRASCCIPPARRRRMPWCAARSRSLPSLYNMVFTKQTGRRAGGDLLPARRHADQPLCRRHHQDQPQNPNAAKLFLNWASRPKARPS